MALVQFTLSMDEQGTDIDEVVIGSVVSSYQEVKNTYIDAFINFISDPTDVSGIIVPFQDFFINEYGDSVMTSDDQVAQETLQTTSVNNVVQMNMDGNIISSSDNAYFSGSKYDVKNSLGSIEKISDNEILIADSENKRAIIVDVVLDQIKWEYNSDRYVVDAHLVPVNKIAITISDSGVTNSDIVINENQTVIWENATTQSITIYSGDITDIDDEDVDLDDFGDVFKSSVLLPLDRFAFKFSEGEYSWFSSPDFTKGSISVTKTRISPLNQYIILERDNLESPFSSRMIKIDAWGKILLEFGKGGYLVKPSDARAMNDNKILIST